MFSVEDYNAILTKRKKIVDKQIYVVENPDRADNFNIDKTAYMSVVNEFLDGLTQ